MRQNLFQRFIAVLFGKFGVIVIGAITTPVVVRIIDQAEYGIYAFILSTVMIVSAPIHSGFLHSLRKYLAENQDSNDWIVSIFQLHAKIVLTLSISASLIIALVTAIGLSEVFYPDIQAIYFYIGAIFIVSKQLYLLVNSGLMGLRLERISEPLGVVQKLIFACCGILLAYLGYGAIGLLSGSIIGFICCMVLGIIALSREFDLFSKPSMEIMDDMRRPVYRFSLSSGFLSVLIISIAHIDILLMQLFTNSQQTGFYKAALVTTEFIWFIPIALQTLFLQGSSELWANDETSKINEMAAKTLRYNLLILSLLVIGLFVLAEPFIRIYFGSAYLPAVQPLLILLPGVLAYGLIRPLISIGEGRGAFRILLVATGTAAVTNLFLNILLIPTYGIDGAAIGTSIAYFSMMVAHIYGAHQIGYKPLSDLRLLRILATAFLTLLILWFVSSSIQNIYTKLIIIPPLGLLIYTVFALVTGAFDLQEGKEILIELNT